MFRKLPATFEEVHRVFSDGSAGFDIKDLGTLNTSHDSDLLFLGELHIIQEIIDAVSAITSISSSHFRKLILLTQLLVNAKYFCIFIYNLL